MQNLNDILSFSVHKAEPKIRKIFGNCYRFPSSYSSGYHKILQKKKEKRNENEYDNFCSQLINFLQFFFT